MTHTVTCCNIPCKAQVSVNFDPKDFTHRMFCPPCREKRFTHNLLPFCTHGNILLAPSGKPISCDCVYEDVIDSAVWDWVPAWTTDLSGLTLKDIGRVYGDEVCKNCGEPAKNYVGCVLGPPPGACGACEGLTNEQRVEVAKAKGIPVGEPEME